MHAAASTAEVVSQQIGDRAALNIGSTAALARQLDAGAPGSLFISADPAWTTHVASKRGGTVTAVASNHLVLAARQGDAPPTLRTLGTASCVITADPDTVPLGRYAKAALAELDAWTAIESHVRPAAHATAAAAALLQGVCPVAVLYATDAARPGLIAGQRLPGQVTVTMIAFDTQGQALAASLLSEAGRAAWTAHGFEAP